MNGWTFLRPEWLGLLVLLPVAWLVLRRRCAAGRGPWDGRVDPELLAAQRTATDGVLCHRRLRRWLLSAALLVVILAGPSWERTPPLRFQPDAPPLALVAALEPGMAAQRLQQLRARLHGLLDALPERPASLWAAGDRAWRVMPATTDLRLLARLVEVLSPALLPRRGWDPAAALHQVVDRVGYERPPELVLVADRMPEGTAVALAPLFEKGVRVHVLALAPDPRLESLAKRGNGVFSTDPHRLAQALTPPRQAPADSGRPVPVDGGPWLLLLLLAGLLPAFRRGALPVVWLVLLLPPPADADWRAWFFNRDQRAWTALRNGHPEQAAMLFEDPLWRAVALYRAGDYEAVVRLLEPLDTAVAHYDRGNALVRLGRLEDAAAAYRRALELAPGMVDARHNLALVEQALAEAEVRPPAGLPPMRMEMGGEGEPKAAQEILAPPEGARPPDEQEAPEPEALKAGAGGGLLQVLDRRSDSETDDSGMTGQAPEHGGDRTGDSNAPPRAGGRRDQGSEAASTPAVAEVPASRRPPLGRPPAPSRQAGGEEGVESQRASPGRGEGEEQVEAPAGTTGKTAQTSAAPDVRMPLESWLDLVEDDPAALLQALFQQQMEAER